MCSDGFLSFSSSSSCRALHHGLGRGFVLLAWQGLGEDIGGHVFAGEVEELDHGVLDILHHEVDLGDKVANALVISTVLGGEGDEGFVVGV